MPTVQIAIPILSNVNKDLDIEEERINEPEMDEEVVEKVLGTQEGVEAFGTRAYAGTLYS
ncbi:hypothetical protein K435DRAFT_785992 [Dendrothele bispora CBS 962.96]|uniref:Uncharacterized protein n=1 Tax=Dendrothele bispora (strain CBS 962.96) TaxID=1314807 RepID=A0A4S8KTJ9_DENBC|nr:hypothetical protein K435DRAFT_785992 [Dendrothele bispora CBS 962.96]